MHFELKAQRLLSAFQPSLGLSLWLLLGIATHSLHRSGQEEWPEVKLAPTALRLCAEARSRKWLVRAKLCQTKCWFCATWISVSTVRQRLVPAVSCRARHSISVNVFRVDNQQVACTSEILSNWQTNWRLETEKKNSIKLNVDAMTKFRNNFGNEWKTSRAVV